MMRIIKTATVGRQVVQRAEGVLKDATVVATVLVRLNDRNFFRVACETKALLELEYFSTKKSA